MLSHNQPIAAIVSAEHQGRTVTEIPVTEIPVTEIPATEIPATEIPATEIPVTEIPVTEIGFYHLTRSTPAQALPRLLARTLAAGQRALVLGRNDVALNALSTALWAQPAWLPHGTAADGDPDLQPIWLATDAEPLNGARYLFLIEGAETDRIARYERVFDLFDGNDDAAVEAARLRWKAAQQAGRPKTYWQQTNSGWQKSA